MILAVFVRRLCNHRLSLLNQECSCRGWAVGLRAVQVPETGCPLTQVLKTTAAADRSSGVAVNYAQDDVAGALQNDSYVIIPVLANDSGNNKRVTTLRQGDYGTAQIWENGTQVIYHVGGWVGQRGLNRVEEIAFTARQRINRWFDAEEAKINNAHTIHLEALDFLEVA